MSALDEAAALSARAPGGFADILVLGRRIEFCSVTDTDGNRSFRSSMRFLEAAPKHLWVAARDDRLSRRSHLPAGQGRERALELVEQVLPAIEQAPMWARNYNALVCRSACTLWLLGRNDHADVIERNIRDKIVAADFRYPMVDGRLAMARLCALQGRLDEARQWFAKARTVLEEQGARPLRAICDYDEALALVRDRGTGHPRRTFLSRTACGSRTTPGRSSCAIPRDRHDRLDGTGGSAA